MTGKYQVRSGQVTYQGCPQWCIQFGCRHSPLTVGCDDRPITGLRRQAEDLIVPIYFHDLKTFQLSNMNMVIDTMMAFLGGADPEILSLVIEQPVSCMNNEM